LIDMLLVVRAYRGNRGVLPLTWVPSGWHAQVAGDWGILTDPEQVEFALSLIVLIPLAIDLLLVLWKGLRHDDASKRTSCCRLVLCSVLDVSAVVYGYLHVPAQPFAPGAWSLVKFGQFGPLLSVSLVSSIATVDSIMAKMSGRTLLPRVVPLTAALLGLSLVGGGWPYAICATLAYHLLAIRAVCDALHLPLLGHVTTVFVDGVYDMCHLGHLNILRRAAEHGDRLMVGLGTDECCSIWKRPPIMSFAERRATLLALPWVSGVIPIDRFDCEFSAAFLEEHHVDVLCYGEEYDPVLNPEFAKRVASGMAPDFYRVARTGGVTGRREQAAERRESRARAVVLPRTAGVSTSEIIQRLAARIEQDKDALMKRNDGGSADKKNV
jgi:cytidyltransferase-like protein